MVADLACDLEPELGDPAFDDPQRMRGRDRQRQGRGGSPNEFLVRIASGWRLSQLAQDGVGERRSRAFASPLHQFDALVNGYRPREGERLGELP